MPEEIHWHSLQINTVFQKLNSTEKGLDSIEAKKRLKEFGLNSFLIKTSETIPRILLRQLQNPIVYTLLFSTGLAFALGKFTDGLVVLSVVILNTLIGFFQEYRAHKIIGEISKMIPLSTTVIRKGKMLNAESSQIVPGDIIVLQPGDKIPADLRLFSVKNLQCDESSLTGESHPISKTIDSLHFDTPLAERKCMAFSGTYVTAGTGLGIVTTTGLKTEFGKISELLEQTTPLETPLSKTLKTIALWITSAVAIVGSILFIIGYFRGSTLLDSAFAAVTLAVAAIPEGLPAIITIGSAIGVQRMAKKQAIIRQLPAIEALGSTTVICTDKTGTLTHNEMTVQSLWTPSGLSFVTGSGYSLEGRIILPENQGCAHEEVYSLLEAAILCNDARIDDQGGLIGDPTELALIIAARKYSFDENTLRGEFRREDVIPFEPEKRLMATLHTSSSSKQYIFIKGAPETLLQICDIDSITSSTLVKVIDEMAEDGMRILAISKKTLLTPLKTLSESEIQEGFTLLGLIGMSDPPRKEVYKALKACHRAGITVKMITGDHPKTAKAIGKELGFLTDDQGVITGQELDQFDEEGWRQCIPTHHVFARTAPEHKLKLVEALQKESQVVAMTGDGVNDAPALKRADIGIAMGIKGTAVAKEASDVILADDNFANIEAAVEEGRRVYDNLIKSITFIFATSFAQALLILISVLFFPIQENTIIHPTSPVQILWINLVVAVALALPLAFEKSEPDLMIRSPRSKKEPILNIFSMIRLLLASLMMSIGAIGLFLWQHAEKLASRKEELVALAEAQTMAVTTIILFQIIYLFHCRTLKSSAIQVKLFSNPAMILGVVVVLLAQIAFIYIPFMNLLFYSSPLSLRS